MRDNVQLHLTKKFVERTESFDFTVALQDWTRYVWDMKLMKTP